MRFDNRISLAVYATLIANAHTSPTPLYAEIISHDQSTLLKHAVNVGDICLRVCWGSEPVCPEGWV